jgi:hypothetical protein
LYGSIGVVALALYFLSLGPVTRYWCRTTPVVPLVTAGGVTKTSTTTYPRWVVIVYYPAFSLLSGGNLGGAYSRYLGWWNTQEPQKK